MNVMNCLNQLQVFKSQGLEVTSAIPPLTEQLAELVNLQIKHVESLRNMAESLKKYVNDFNSEACAHMKK